MPRGFGIVKVFTFPAVEFDGLNVRKVGHASREERVILTHDTGAFAEVTFLVFLELKKFSQPVNF